MTITVANTALSNTWEYWRTRTNELAYAMSTYAVTTNSNTATGNAAISGTFTANVIIANYISMGANNTINTSIIIANSATINVATITSAIVTTANLTTINANVVNSNTANLTSVTGNTLVFNTANLTTINANVVNSNTINANVINANTANLTTISGNTLTLVTHVKVGNSTVNNTLIGANSTLQSNGQYFWNANGSWVIPTFTITAPGSNTYIAINDSGSLNAVAGFTFDKASNTLFVANSVNIGNTNVTYITGTTSGNSTVTLDSFLLSTYRTAEYIISIKDTTANGYQAVKTLIIHDGTTAYMTEYGNINTNTSLASFTVTTNSTATILQITPSATTASIKAIRTTIGV